MPEEPPEPEPEPVVGHCSSEVQVEVLSRRGRLVEICVGFRDPALRGSPTPFTREQVALAAFFVEAAYRAGLEQPAPGDGAVSQLETHDTGRAEQSRGHGWLLNDTVDDAILIDPEALARVAPRLGGWAQCTTPNPGAILLDPAASSAVAPRLALTVVKRADQTHRCSMTGAITLLFQMTSSKWSRACTPGLILNYESFVATRVHHDLAGMMDQALQSSSMRARPLHVQPQRGHDAQSGPVEAQLRVAASTTSERTAQHPFLTATVSDASVVPASAPPRSPAASPQRSASVGTRRMNGLQLDPKIQHLRVRLRSMSYGSGRYSRQDPASVFQQFDKDNSGELDQEEFFAAVRKGGGLTKRDVSDRELLKLFRTVDSDGDGMINIDEFTVFVWGGSKITDSGKEVSGPIKTTSAAHIASIVAWGEQREARREKMRREQEQARAEAEREEIEDRTVHRKPISVGRAESLAERLSTEKLRAGQIGSGAKSTAPENSLDTAGTAVRWPECQIEGLLTPEPPPKRAISTPEQQAVTTDRLYVPAGQVRKKLIDQHRMAEEKERDQYRTWLPSDKVDQWPRRLGKWGPQKLEAIEKERRMRTAVEHKDLLSRRALSDREIARLNQLSKATEHKKHQESAVKSPEANAAEVRRRKEARKRAAATRKQDAAIRAEAAAKRAAEQAKKRKAEEELMEREAAAAEKKRVVALWSGKLALILDDSDHECAGQIGRVLKVNPQGMTGQVRLEGCSGSRTVRVPLSVLAPDSSAEYREKRKRQAARREAAVQNAEEELLRQKANESQHLILEQDTEARKAELQREFSTHEAALVLEQELKRRRAWLGQVPLFQGLATDSAFISELATKLEVRTAHRGTTVIEKGTDGDEMYFLVRGEAQVLSALDQPPFVTLKSGSFFGEGALLEGGLRNAYVCAGTSMKLYVLSKDHLEAVLVQFPDVRDIIMLPLDERRLMRVEAEDPLTLARTTWLGAVPLFEGLATDGAFIRELAMKLTVLAKEPGEILIEKDTTGAEMYFIVQGEVEVLTVLDEPPFVVLPAGSFFGEAALLENGTRNAYVRARETVQLYVLSKENLGLVLEQYPDVEAIISRPLHERCQARKNAEVLQDLSCVRAKLLECDVGQWLEECQMLECEVPLRENMIETVDDLLFLAPEGDFELLVGLGLTSTQARALRITLCKVFQPEVLPALGEEGKLMCEENSLAASHLMNSDDTVTGESQWNMDIEEWLVQADATDCEPVLRNNMIETMEDLLFLAPDVDTGQLVRMGLTVRQATKLQSAATAHTHRLHEDGPHRSNPVSAFSEEVEDTTSMLLQLVEEAHETVQNMHSTKHVVAGKAPAVGRLDARSDAHTRGTKAPPDYASTVPTEAGGRSRARRRSEVISADLSKLEGMLAALQDDVNGVASSPTATAQRANMSSSATAI